MLFKDFLHSPCGIDFMVETLPLRSAVGRRVLLQSPLMTHGERIDEAYARLGRFAARFGAGADPSARRTLGRKLEGLKDAVGAIRTLTDGTDADDVTFFQIKSLARCTQAVRELLLGEGIDDPALPDLQAVTDLLDPDRTGTASFTLYDTYDDGLAALRRRIRTGASADGELLAAVKTVEERVRRMLSERLKPYAGALTEALEGLGQTDLLLARAEQVAALGLTLPCRSHDGTTAYAGLFHPGVRAHVEAEGKAFQPVDLRFDRQPVTLIGTNMGGKTVVLRTAALAQLLFQFGFGIPAAEAAIYPVDALYVRVGDADGSGDGRSSFGAEIEAIDRMLRATEGFSSALVVLDEPARTTNPVEGAALVTALVNLLGRRGVPTLLATHYNLPLAACRRLKVRGLTPTGMDYRLEETPSGAVPHEALAVARQMGVDATWIDAAERILTEQTKCNI